MKVNALMALAILALLLPAAALRAAGDQDHLVGCAGARSLSFA